MSPYLETQNGGRTYFDTPEEIDIEGLIWGCARQPRWNGQFRPFVWYSVAEHQVHIGRAMEAKLRGTRTAEKYRQKLIRTAICHDLSEGILGDMATPQKARNPQYIEDEDRLNRALAEKLDLIYPWPAAVRVLDARILHDEVAQLLTPGIERDWLPHDLPPLGVELEYWSPNTAYGIYREMLCTFGVPLRPTPKNPWNPNSVDE